MSLTSQDIIVIISAFLISASGLFINYKKNPSKDNVFIVKDNGSLTLFRILIPSAIIISIIIYFIKRDIMLFDAMIFMIVGCVFVVLGLAIRWKAIITLGTYFNVKVTIHKDQKLYTDGIFKYIRHPSYSGLILYYVGLGLIMMNMLSFLVLFLSAMIVVLIRIKVEEKVLEHHFGPAYIEYKSRSYKIIPFVY